MLSVVELEIGPGPPLGLYCFKPPYTSERRVWKFPWPFLVFGGMTQIIILHLKKNSLQGKSADFLYSHHRRPCQTQLYDERRVGPIPIQTIRLCPILPDDARRNIPNVCTLHAWGHGSIIFHRRVLWLYDARPAAYRLYTVPTKTLIIASI